jgi:peptidoglycan/LPS O-acetylase OafA/YrhL
VEIFFVISGYLITGLLLSEFGATGRIRYRHFYWRRAVRLGPALLVAVAFSLLWLLVLGRPFASWWAGLVGTLTYTTDFFSLFHGAPIGDYFQWSWSLGIEEQFYMLWPLALVILIRWGRFIPTVVILGALALTDWVVRSLMFTHGIVGAPVWFGPFSHYDALLLGSILAIVLARFPTNRALLWAGNVLGPIGAVALVLLVVTGYGAAGSVLDPYAYGETAVAAAAVVLWVARDPGGWFSRVMALRPIAFLGRLSYGIYLWNIVLFWAFLGLFGTRPSGSPFGFVWILAVVGVAYVSYRYVEHPLRKRWAPPRAHAVVAGADTVENLSPAPHAGAHLNNVVPAVARHVPGASRPGDPER